MSEAQEPSRSKKLIAAGLGILALTYLLNPGAGIFEIIPDNLPVLGNLDEATAVTLLLTCLRVYGWDLTAWLPGKRQRLKDSETDKKSAP
ncbi:DUF1232 domain-containing protein [bacterium (Candidatus Blackallbacteria) CG17_big_fil_post_rev_8_21_14_2_50_48_46]|uniref:DUF1232 domain-containing protein n=1 Tax=bacterium (Candidatus Blackallbacteria) CG17_big_fil_post_rev_8_21_14_2_50_48_46 TaxID=2014261 RepID=A0A2M7G6U9_9BACT|nr:MAG: DUF1232 domain-containing protein [bacterium (Candidatus Blackallbacteria) CG18_big_fil_WC_8_21_14_2_50_49_26]PIW17777.1 MAG: DUF1232 domain-containing protein [bacterium (Candidatus Blackallbacteria) CG17_big_fil_post_rev_8_21_14_2_50_48_46]PIW47336.1 MAG: DUF1232 domain-containing protein [bacterium (Candidatus Blackallbacteria) CG13_big_fil_rev_8_21_14_2_50_49_14]